MSSLLPPLDWKFSETTQRLVREFLFKTYTEAIEFVVEVAKLAEKKNHHPDINIEYKKVTVSLWTHSTQSITMKDMELAEMIHALLATE